MKWTHPGHELDNLGARYLRVKNLYIYGVDEISKKTYDFLQWLGVADEFSISFVIDITNFKRESDHTFCGKRVIAFQTDLSIELCSAFEESVIALPWVALANEREILERTGFANIFYLSHSHNRSDNFIQNFVCVWLMYKHGKLLSHWTNFVTTLKCNLNCSHCLNYTEFIIDPKDVSFEDFKEHIDILFSKFDYLYSLHFTGGEPMLVKELPRFLRYIEDNYKDRIFEFFVITNATIIPNEEVMSAIKSMNGSFFLDDYSASVPNSKVEEIKKALKAHDIGYIVGKAEYWFDLDIKNTDNTKLSNEELENYKDNCHSFLHEFGEKRIYACCYQQYANRAGIGTTTSNDYIDIDSTSKMEILEFRQGYTLKGYVDFCKQCRGLGSNAKKVATAIQMPRKSITKEQEQPKTNVKMKDLVSICVPIYNTGKYLVRCVDSLIAQTYSNLEIVLVDDGSTDNCGMICDDYARIDSRVVVVHKDNGGEASGRNAGLRAAKGDYIMFIDSDDEYLPNAVELMIEAVKSDEVDLVMGGYLERRGEIEHFATGHLRSYSAKEAAHGYLYPDCNYGIIYIISTVNAKLFRREIISANSISFDERFVVGNDMLFICEYLKHTRTVYDIFAPIYVYYKFHPSERIQGMAWHYPDAFFLFAYVADQMIKIAQPDENEYKQLIIKQYKDLLNGLVNASANKERFQNGLMPYLTSFCSEIDLLQIGASLDLAEDYIKKEDGALPIRLISYLIVNKRFNELYEMLQAIGKARKIIPFEGQQVRQMIQLEHERSENHDESIVVSMIKANEELHSDRFSFTDDKILVEQVNELVSTIITGQRQIDACEAELNDYKAKADTYKTELETTIIASQRQVDSYEAKIDEYKAKINEYEAKINDCEAKADTYKTEIDHYIQSSSWRVTKPLRVIGRVFRKSK